MKNSDNLGGGGFFDSHCSVVAGKWVCTNLHLRSRYYKCHRCKHSEEWRLPPAAATIQSPWWSV